MIDLKESVLNLSEFESIRLVDLNDITQKEAGKQMQISQSTLSRILKSGRKKIADAIINSKAIKIERYETNTKNLEIIENKLDHSN